MPVDLTTIFGNEITVSCQPRQADRQYTGFPGADGVTSMMLGTRGRQLIVHGILRANGASYSAARSNVQDLIDDIEAYQWADAAEYTFKGETYSYMVFDRLQLVPDGQGRLFHWLSTGYVSVEFICFMRVCV